MNEKPVSVTIGPWLKSNLGRYALVGCTGTDHRALRAAVEIVSLYAFTGDIALAAAFAAVVRKMQPTCRDLAYHSIAHVMDWDDRPRFWALSGLEPLGAPSVCKFEPADERRAA